MKKKVFLLICMSISYLHASQNDNNTHYMSAPKRDLSKATIYLKNLAKHGDVEAMRRLARIYRDLGQHDMAKKYHQKAAAQRSSKKK